MNIHLYMRQVPNACEVHNVVWYVQRWNSIVFCRIANVHTPVQASCHSLTRAFFALNNLRKTAQYEQKKQIHFFKLRFFSFFIARWKLNSKRFLPFDSLLFPPNCYVLIWRAMKMMTLLFWEIIFCTLLYVNDISHA